MRLLLTFSGFIRRPCDRRDPIRSKLVSLHQDVVDERDEPGLFWLTGSQLFQLMENVRESLAGRVAVMNLFPLSYGELVKDHSPPYPQDEELLIERWKIRKEISFQTIAERIFEGGMPRLVLHRDIELQQFFSSYLQTYLQKDVRDVTHILDMSIFLRLFSC